MCTEQRVTPLSKSDGFYAKGVKLVYFLGLNGELKVSQILLNTAVHDDVLAKVGSCSCFGCSASSITISSSSSCTIISSFTITSFSTLILISFVSFSISIVSVGAFSTISAAFSDCCSSTF